jgi:glycosyltransferase involved in cell wall biosynthesis
MRIAVVGPAYPYKGGSAQHTTLLAHRLAAAGHQTTLHSWRKQYPKLLYPGQLTVDRPEVEPFPDTARSLAWNRPDSWWMTGSRLARRRYDVAVLAVVTPIQVPAYLTLARAARAGGCKVVALCHNVLPHERHRFDEPAMRALLRYADAVIVHSDEEAARAAALTRSPVEIASLPLHLPAHPGRAPARSMTGTRSYRLLFFGIVRRYKGLDVLLRALAAAQPRASLTVAGEIWEGRSELLGLISDLRLGDRVTLTDAYVPIEDVAGLFAAADALVLPYLSGTASQNALIALQYGLPVIATRVGALAESVIDGVNGLLCAPGDVDDLTAAINAVYEPGTLERLRAGVRPPDSEAAWQAYLAAVIRASSYR